MQEGCKLCEKGLPHIVTLSAPGAVRVETHTREHDVAVECVPETGIITAYSILDSSRKAMEKDGKQPPENLIKAIALLRGMVPS